MKKCDPRAYVACIYKSSCGQMGDVYYAEGSECEQFNEQIISRPRTNADTIRAMSDEELAELICGKIHECSDERCPGASLCNGTDGRANGMLKWLRQPAEEGGGDDGAD
jgi:hypothetical protein